MSRTKRKIKYAGWHRAPKTQAEKRAVAAALSEGVKVRAKRTEKHLPDTYDDLLVSAQREKVVDKPKTILT